MGHFNRKYFILSTFIILFILFLLSCRQTSIGDDFTSNSKPSQNIISLSPALTDIIMDFDTCFNLSGITDYCSVPDNMRTARVGTLLDIDIESIFLLKPDIIFLTPYHALHFAKLRELNINYIPIELNSIYDILVAIDTVGNYLGDSDRATVLIEEINETIFYYSQLALMLEPLNILMVIARHEGDISSFYAVGSGNFLNEIIELLNCKNPLSGHIASYPLIGREEATKINPDIIIELYADYILESRQINARLRDWESIPNINAVRNSNVFLINKKYIVRPSSKIKYIIKDIYNIIEKSN